MYKRQVSGDETPDASALLAAVRSAAAARRDAATAAIDAAAALDRASEEATRPSACGASSASASASASGATRAAKRAAEALAAAREALEPARVALRRRLRGVREEAKAYAGAPEGEEEVAWDGGLERIEWALEDAIEVVDREAPGTDAPGDARLS